MYIDNELEMATTVALDLGPKRPGPGKPICLYTVGVGASLVVTTGDDATAGDALITVDATNDADGMEFKLPSNTKRYIKATFVQGRVFVVMDGQTNDAAFA